MATSAWRRIYFALGVPTTALATIAGASALAHYRVVAAVFALAAAVFSALMTFTNPAGQLAEHRRASSRYQALANRARLLSEVGCADGTDTAGLRQELDVLIDEWSKSNEGSPPLFESLRRRAQRRTAEGA
jgi:hypothetical protein